MPAAKMRRTPVPKERTKYKQRDRGKEGEMAMQGRGLGGRGTVVSWVSRSYFGFNGFPISGASQSRAMACFLPFLSLDSKNFLSLLHILPSELFLHNFLFLITERLLTRTFIFAAITKF